MTFLIIEQTDISLSSSLRSMSDTVSFWFISKIPVVKSRLLLMLAFLKSSLKMLTLRVNGIISCLFVDRLNIFADHLLVCRIKLQLHQNSPLLVCIPQCRSRIIVVDIQSESKIARLSENRNNSKKCMCIQKYICEILLQFKRINYI